MDNRTRLTSQHNWKTLYMTFTEHKNLVFDNDQDIHTNFGNHEKMSMPVNDLDSVTVCTNHMFHILQEEGC